MANEIGINEIVFNVQASLLMMALNDDETRRKLLIGKMVKDGIWSMNEDLERLCAECGEYTENRICMGTGKIFVGEKEVEFVYLCDHHIKIENGVFINCKLVRMEWPSPR